MPRHVVALTDDALRSSCLTEDDSRLSATGVGISSWGTINVASSASAFRWTGRVNKPNNDQAGVMVGGNPCHPQLQNV